jgi:hypothetical protein
MTGWLVETFNIQSSTNDRIEVWDQLGKLILVKEITQGNNEINIQDLTSGVYFIKSINERWVKKVIKLVTILYWCFFLV